MTPEQAANFLNNLGLGDIVNLSAGSLLAQIFDVSDGYDFSGIASFLRTIGIVFMILFLALIIVTLYRIVLFNLRLAQKSTPLKIPPLSSRWEEVKRHAASFEEGQWKFSIIEADKLLDDVLRALGYPGESVGDRLKFIRKENLPSLDALWHAHRLRNRLVHEPGYTLSRDDMEEAIRNYKIALQELGAL
jgi:hypothetical protein